MNADHFLVEQLQQWAESGDIQPEHSLMLQAVTRIKRLEKQLRHQETIWEMTHQRYNELKHRIEGLEREMEDLKI